MRSTGPLFKLMCTLTLPAAFMAPAAQAEPFEPGLVQVFFGSLNLDDQSGNWAEVSNQDVDVDFSPLLSLGIETEYLIDKGWLHVGINPGGSLALNNKDMRVTGARSNQSGPITAEVDSSLGLAEIHLGGFIRGRLHERITTYAAAGPMFLYGKFEVDSVSIDGNPSALDVGDDSSSAFNIGYYARAGIDFEFQANRHLGFGMRYLSTELDFDDTVGKLDIEGPQWLFSYTQQW